MGRWPTKPRADDKCDCHTGSGLDITGKPVILRCTNFAVETVKDKKFPLFPVYICETCLEENPERWERNPRRKA